jgi:murein DD-endopeptidase MepM/ murein hydrolase activator NlpD
MTISLRQATIYKLLFSLAFGLMLGNTVTLAAGLEGYFEGPDSAASETEAYTGYRFPRREEFFLPLKLASATWGSGQLDIYRYDVLRLVDSFEVIIDDASRGKRFTFPLKGEQSSGFGPRSLFNHRFHFGVDILAKENEPIFAAMDGIVRVVGYDGGGYGNFVVIAHENGLETLYGHLNAAKVRTGQWVKSGTTIGLAGSTGQSTGTHLHFEFKFLGEQFNPNLVLDLDAQRVKRARFHVKPGFFLHLLEMKEGPYYYTVRKAEKLLQVAKLYSLSVSKLAKLNSLTENAYLEVGQRIRLK